MVLPDLFSPPSSSFLRQPPSSTVISDTTTAPRRPEDLPSAIKHLTDQELAQLHTVVLDELQRRGKKPPSNENSRKRRSEKAVVPLTIGKLNAIRAAFKAGITPSRIARQFRISQSHEKALPEIQKHVERMDKLQYLLYADGNQSLLVVLQALDAAGKDGVIRHIMGLKLPPTRVDIADIRRKFHAAEREQKGGGKRRMKAHQASHQAALAAPAEIRVARRSSAPVRETP